MKAGEKIGQAELVKEGSRNAVKIENSKIKLK
jgi:hypothetical protein